jgi:hypothetical protein
MYSFRPRCVQHQGYASAARPHGGKLALADVPVILADIDRDSLPRSIGPVRSSPSQERFESCIRCPADLYRFRGRSGDGARRWRKRISELRYAHAPTGLVAFVDVACVWDDGEGPGATRQRPVIVRLVGQMQGAREEKRGPVVPGIVLSRDTENHALKEPCIHTLIVRHSLLVGERAGGKFSRKRARQPARLLAHRVHNQ